MPYQDLIDGDMVWVGTPRRDRADRGGARRVRGPRRDLDHGTGGFAHWQAIKAQEFFADRVMPHFRSGDRDAEAAIPHRRLAICEFSTLDASFEDDLRAYAAAGIGASRPGS